METASGSIELLEVRIVTVFGTLVFGLAPGAKLKAQGALHVAEEGRLVGLAGSASLGRRRRESRAIAMERLGSLSQQTLPGRDSSRRGLLNNVPRLDAANGAVGRARLLPSRSIAQADRLPRGSAGASPSQKASRMSRVPRKHPQPPKLSARLHRRHSAR
jgi:hypothetical protein